jgi:hypothetical protein
MVTYLGVQNLFWAVQETRSFQKWQQLHRLEINFWPHRAQVT